MRRLRQLAAPAAAGAPAAATAAVAPAAAAGGLTGPLCNSCWQRGHYKSNRQCPNFGKPALEQPRAFGRAKRVRSALFDSSSDEAEESAEEDGNDNVCHGCGKPGELFECDTCSRSWHGECLSEASRALATNPDEASWSCPICRREPRPVGYVGNPQRPPPGRGGGQQRARLRSASEGSKPQRAATKKRGREAEQPRFR